jgi:hypothetical protein
MRTGARATVRISSDPARLDLENQKASVRVGEDEVCLAVADPAVVGGSAEPGDVRDDSVLGAQCGTQASGYEPFCILALGHARSLPVGCGRRTVHHRLTSLVLARVGARRLAPGRINMSAPDDRVVDPTRQQPGDEVAGSVSERRPETEENRPH